MTMVTIEPGVEFAHSDVGPEFTFLGLLSGPATGITTDSIRKLCRDLSLARSRALSLWLNTYTRHKYREREMINLCVYIHRYTDIGIRVYIYVTCLHTYLPALST